MTAKHAIYIFGGWCLLCGCLDDVGEQRPGPQSESDAEVFDARKPIVAPSTGSGYGGSGQYQSGAYALEIEGFEQTGTSETHDEASDSGVEHDSGFAEETEDSSE